MAGSKHFARLNRKRWQWARLKCFEAAGWRCSRCQRRGRLECHHRVRLEDGGAPYDLQNLECLCRACHIAEHRHDRSTPGRGEWKTLVDELMST